VPGRVELTLNSSIVCNICTVFATHAAIRSLDISADISILAGAVFQKIVLYTPMATRSTLRKLTIGVDDFSENIVICHPKSLLARGPDYLPALERLSLG
jgi:hypothetical protein